MTGAPQSRPVVARQAMSPQRSWENPEEMIGVDEAFDRILACFSPLPSVELSMLDALGMVTTHDVISTVDVPPFRNSAMDGFAVRSEDTAAAPVELRVVGMIAAGTAPDHAVGPGEAIRIMTGAPMPDGADAVVRFEETDESSRGAGGGTITISRSIDSHENVRDPGEDMRTGQTVVPAGTRLRPAEIGALASLNMATVAVHRRPKVAVLSTGDELVDIGPPLAPGQIRNSNSYTIAAAVHRYGGDPVLLGIARDSTEDLRARLDSAGNPDLYVTSGGVSLGDYDMVKDVLRAEGQIDIWQVRMKPGKPLAFGKIGDTPLLGLPGNPVAALVSFEQFGRPAILRMLGRSDLRLPETEAVLTERLTNPGRRRHYVRAVLTRSEGGLTVCPARNQGAAVLTSAVQANCLIVVHEDRPVAEVGTTVPVQLLDGDIWR